KLQEWEQSITWSSQQRKVSVIWLLISLAVSLPPPVQQQSVGLCTADVLFPEAGGDQTAPQVQCSCEGPLAINASAQEEAFYRRLRGSNSPVTGNSIPGMCATRSHSFGFIAPDMKPLWILAGVASSFVMLKESNENTLYNLAQVANVTQLESEDKQLKFQYHVLLHEMVSQEIIHWKLLVTWAPAGGVSVLHPERQPHCHDCVLPPATAPKERSDPECSSPMPEMMVSLLSVSKWTLKPHHGEVGVGAGGKGVPTGTVNPKQGTDIASKHLFHILPRREREE
ncbi:hypothetical protein Z043_121124, partial [Scleropages formosus]